MIDDYKIKSINNEKKAKLVEVYWNNGTSGLFPYVWLRENAPEAATVRKTESVNQRLLMMKDWDLNVSPMEVKLANDCLEIEIKWDSETSAGVKYTSQFLRERNLSDENFRKERKTLYQKGYNTWGSEINEILTPSADWVKMMQTPKETNAYLLEQLNTFLKYGILHVVNVPKKIEALDDLTKILGYDQNTHHGSRFQTISIPNKDHLAYGGGELELHTDLPYLGSVPEVQVLHCIKQSGDGGNSTFADGYKVAELLKKENREAYDILTSVPLEFLDRCLEPEELHKGPSYMVINRETISLDNKGNPCGIYFSTAHRSWMMDTDVKMIPKVYEALKLFRDYCYQERNIFERKLNEGELMMFMNVRVLHGRKGFDASKSERHLEGAYYNLDVLRSTARLIEEKLGKSHHVSM